MQLTQTFIQKLLIIQLVLEEFELAEYLQHLLTLLVILLILHKILGVITKSNSVVPIKNL
jgi:hypothetical protein